jgi:hypothetical protein
MNADMKKLRKELLHGRARHALVPLGFGGSWRLWVRCWRWSVAPAAPVAPLHWHERLAKLTNRKAVR